MLNFNNTLTSKIISLAIAVSFLVADISYADAGAYSQGSLRVPMGESNKRMKGAIEIIGGAQLSAASREIKPPLAEIQSLLDGLKNGDSNARVNYCIIIMPWIRNKPYRDQALIFLDDLDNEVRVSAVNSLSVIAATDHEVKSKLMNILANRVESWSVREAILNNLSLVLSRGDNKTKSKLINILANRGESPSVRIAILNNPSLALSKGDNKTKSKLINILTDPREDVDVHIAILNNLSLVLSKGDNKTKSKLRNILTDRGENPSVRVAILNNLSLVLSRGDNKTKSKLIGILTDYGENAFVRIAILNNLSLVLSKGDNKTKSKLINILTDPRESWSVRAAILNNLSLVLSKDDDTAKSKLINILTDRGESPSVRAAILNNLSLVLSKDDDTAKSKLRNILTDPREDWRVRAAILNNLSLISNDNTVVRKLLTDPIEHIRKTAAYILRFRGYNAQLKDIWMDSQSFMSPLEEYHRWLSFLHRRPHLEFLKWVNSRPLEPPIGILATKEDRLVSQERPSDISEKIDASGSRWLGRSLVIDDSDGTGATVYKAPKAGEDLAGLIEESGLWNKIHPEEDPSLQSRMVRVVLTNAPVKDSPVNLITGTPTLMLRYHVKDKKVIDKYPPAWKVRDADTLIQWMDTATGYLRGLVDKGFGYTSIMDHYHDLASGRRYSLDINEAGCVDNIVKSMGFSNLRESGELFDLNPQHMVRFGDKGPTGAQLAKMIRDQVFQLALIASLTAQINGFSEEDLTSVLRNLGLSMSKRYDMPLDIWEKDFPIDLSTVSREMLYALGHLQGPQRTDLGYDNGPISAPSIALFAESIAKSITQHIIKKQAGYSSGLKLQKTIQAGKETRVNI